MPARPRTVMSWPPTATTVLDQGELLALRRDRGLGELRRAPQLRHGAVGLRCRHHVCERLDDARLGLRDLHDRVAEPAGVIERDRGEHRDLAVADVGRIPLATHADLDHGDIHRRIGEAREGERGERLEVGEARLTRGVELRVDHVEVGPDVVPVRHEGLVGDRLRRRSRSARSPAPGAGWSSVPCGDRRREGCSR